MMIRKVCVLGNTASGKSHLAGRIGEALGLPVTHLDRLYWHSDWSHASRAEFLADQRGVVSQDRWVIDGCFSEFGLADRFQAADVIVFLDRPVWESVRRAARRRGTNRDDLAGDDEAMRWWLTVAFLAEMVLFPLVDRPRIHKAARMCQARRYRVTSWDQEDALIAKLTCGDAPRGQRPGTNVDAARKWGQCDA